MTEKPVENKGSRKDRANAAPMMNCTFFHMVMTQEEDNEDVLQKVCCGVNEDIFCSDYNEERDVLAHFHIKCNTIKTKSFTAILS